jgi:hypothetical protein
MRPDLLVRKVPSLFRSLRPAAGGGAGVEALP